ncbi:Aste57867_19233 [Aphanomyces stellatus]|uniref:Aste57867_15750 protein n=1 Tax=Aphanomyces stellatus TaxID=120398 RepID=A0A485L456_9STRA|nr:hypothetical protein As57867_019169 [Aphanomyces stellatus]KAF0693273.1 hypothetical protein As57867_015694 [Aphanomyces stellatus]VFT92539.1 Aste57867_15750 [Aphanomyces stellatus]VFT95954.1 Aste57867_19233 [Aphanomyces stellatus]
MKKPKASAAELVWSTELVEGIARFILDPYDLLDFLTALEPMKCLGDLAHLHTMLDQADDAGMAKVWPTLRVTSSTFNNPTLRTVVKYYSRFTLLEACDYSWLCVVPSARVHLKAFPATQDKVALAHWFNNLTRLPITLITWRSNKNLNYDNEDTNDNGEEALLHALPRLPHLRGLNIASHFTHMTQLLEFVSTSQLKEFVTGYDDTNYDYCKVYPPLTRWLTAQPVEVFSFDVNDLANIPISTVEEFFTSLTLSSSLTTLSMLQLDLSFLLEFSFRLPKSVRTLNLYACKCSLWVNLAELVENSNLEALSISGASFAMSQEMFIATFLSRVPKSLKSLDLSSCQLTCDECRVLPQALPTTSIVNLNLSDNGLRDEGIGYIAQAIQSSALRILNISSTCVTEAGVKSLIYAARAKPKFFIRMEKNNWDDDTKTRLRKVAGQENTLIVV